MSLSPMQRNEFPDPKKTNRNIRYSDAHQRFIDLYSDIDTSEYNPYPIDWVSEFSPIEFSVWCEIRNYGFHFWPQYPIEMYRADFADIEKKIIIECDGKEFHNKATDAVRDNFLRKSGWRVFRISGSDCNRTIKEDYQICEDLNERRIDDDVAIKQYEEWLTRTAGGLLACIAFHHYGVSHIGRKNILHETLERLSGSVLYERES